MEHTHHLAFDTCLKAFGLPSTTICAGCRNSFRVWGITVSIETIALTIQLIVLTVLKVLTICDNDNCNDCNEKNAE